MKIQADPELFHLRDCPVNNICVGMVFSLLRGGTSREKEKRFGQHTTGTVPSTQMPARKKFMIAQFVFE